MTDLNNDIMPRIFRSGCMWIAATLFAVSCSGSDTRVQWYPPSVDISITQGETTDIEISLSSTGDVTNATLSLSPSLVEYASIQNTNVSLVAYEPITFPLSIVTDPNDQSGMITGFITLKRNGMVLSPALPISIDIQEPPKSTLNSSTVSISYAVPSGWEREPEVDFDESFDVLSSPDALATAAAGNEAIPPEIFVRVVPNPANQSLGTFAANYAGGWYVAYAVQENTQIDGYTALLFDDQSSTIPKTPPVTVLVSVDNQVLIIAAGWNAIDVFDEFLESIEID
ncbi:hypothetical protein [Hyphococcus sp.]|uniref:hypothetical protein n=1 Tax=Hyphococcus sp. TaxID=2038636 RepID=UPI0035C74504